MWLSLTGAIHALLNLPDLAAIQIRDNSTQNLSCFDTLISLHIDVWKLTVTFVSTTV